MYRSLETKTYLDYYNTNSSIKGFVDFLSTFNKKNVIDHVHYWRVYNDQSCFISGTHNQWLNDFLFHFNKFDNTLLEQKLQSSSKTNAPTYAIWHYLSHDKLLQFDHEHGVDIGFDIYIRHKEYVEMLSINGNKFCYDFHDFCINNLHYLHDILKQLREEYKKIEHHRCHLPLRIEAPAKRFFVADSENKIFFTDRERDCIDHIFKGYTAKAIAQELNLSPRTVESHINKIKQRLGVHFKLEMVKKLHLIYKANSLIS